jgi:hypothetical protein
MKTENIENRINELIELAGKVLKTRFRGGSQIEHVNSEQFYEFKTASLSFLKTVFKADHPFYQEFSEKVHYPSPYETELGRGILTAAKREIDGGWIFNLRSLVSADIFSDFMEMAEYLLSEGYKDPAAVMIGSILEEHLRQLCLRNGISIVIIKDEKTIAKKADLLNNELGTANVYNKLDQKSITSWLDLRNKAAHGKYDEYDKLQVELLRQGVMNFISKTN